MEFKGDKGIEKMSATQLGVPFILIYQDKTIAHLYGENAEQNANIFIAAPDLLEALQGIVNMMDDYYIDPKNCELPDMYDAKKAIEKALK